MVRLCGKDEFDMILRIINDAAVAYRCVIPEDRWHEPYMSEDELRFEIADGVVFWCVDEGAGPVAVMGIQDRGDMALVRHAYTVTKMQKSGHGSRLLRHVESVSPRGELLVGTWKAATWAVRFYEKNGYRMVSEDEKNILLRKYWKIPDRQVETSVVLRKMISAAGTEPVL
ncbi:MAG: GNAT family N-acetyltransferase [Spirochaetes bacterium]|nr:GNAT family N-acetyltransferase [Spirochaetota bacterium]